MAPGSTTANDSNGSPAPVTLATNSSSDQTIDFGFISPTGSIGNFVWNDLNNNGIQNSGEPGISGVSETLTGPGGWRTTTTDANGLYQFTGPAAGSYTVKVATPSGYSPATSMAPGSTTANDSNGFFFNDTATTEIYSLSLHDALPICPTGSIGNFVWNDLNNNGIQNSGEPGI